MTERSRPVLGSWEWVRAEHVHETLVKGRVDSGARRTVIHADRIEASGGEVRFTIDKKIVTMPSSGQVKVRSSNGVSQYRHVIQVVMHIGGHLIPVDATLSNRRRMRFPVLIGRDILSGRFLIDVGQQGPCGGQVPS